MERIPRHFIQCIDGKNRNHRAAAHGNECHIRFSFEAAEAFAAFSIHFDICSAEMSRLPCLRKAWECKFYHSFRAMSTPPGEIFESKAAIIPSGKEENDVDVWLMIP